MKRAPIICGVALAHALLAASAMTAVDPPVSAAPVIQLDLVQLAAPPLLPQPPLADLDEDGGGRPAAPSVVRPTPAPLAPPEVPAPPTPAPVQPDIVVGAAPVDSGRPGLGQDVSGDGEGTGSGDGAGPGAGGAPARLILGPSRGQIIAAHPREAFRRRIDGRVEMRCTIRPDMMLENCSVLRETPAGLGFGAAALTLAPQFRFRPAEQGGRPVEGGTIIPVIVFGRG